jgi:hypothetical protein
VGLGVGSEEGAGVEGDVASVGEGALRQKIGSPSSSPWWSLTEGIGRGYPATECPVEGEAVGIEGGMEFKGIFVKACVSVNDSSRRLVELTEERWRHIAERHPEMEAHGEMVLQAVRKPDRQIAGRLSNEVWLYLETDTPSAWLKVVVAYAEGRGYIVTAYARRSIP